VLLLPSSMAAQPGALRMIDGTAFGSGLHPTTALCVELIEELVEYESPAALLDVGTGSGVLALAALLRGVPRAVGVDIDRAAILTAVENRRLNAVDRRLTLVQGGPEAIRGGWPLVVANVLAAPLIEMSSSLVQRVGHGGRLVLSGIAASVAVEVESAYRRLGMRSASVHPRAGWCALVMSASW
jgi:ribosomal protein L11 methyltransferase